MTTALEYQEHATPSAAPRDSSHDLTARLLRDPASSSLVLDIRSDIETSDSLTPQQHDQCEHAMKSPSSFNYKTAFAVMTERRVQRKYKGVYKQYSASTQIVTWVIVLYIIAVFAVNSVRSSTEDEAIFTTDNLFALVLNLLIVFFVVEIVLVVRWLVYWVIVAELATFAVTGRLAAVVWIDTDVSEDDQATRRSILVALIVAEVVTVVAYVLTHYVYPWVVTKRYLNAERWWNIAASSRHYSLTYRSLARFYKRKRVTVTYCGGLDALGQPHGFGVWSDSSFHGEHLRGQWDHGVPVGPFQSQESGSGYCFVNLRIAFCHNRAEASNDEVLYIPKHSTAGLHWGVASIECSVSGGFFSFLPQVHHLTDGVLETPPSSALECLPYLRTPLDAIRALDETVATRSFSFRGGAHGPSSHLPGQDTKEALVFLHGYNCPLDYGMNRLAQLLALGNFPTHIHPFVFSWPTGGTLAYFPAKTLGSESERTAMDFRDFLASLIDAGYASINIIAHSMGARIVFNALARGLLDAVFCEHDSRLDSASLQRAHKARLASLIFSNPDYPRDDFVRDGGGYDLCRQFCHQITIYADQMDGALIWSELLVRKSLFDPLAYSMGKRVHMLHRDHSSERRPSRWSPRWNARSPSTHDLGLDLGKEAVEKNQQAAFPDVVAFAYSQHLDVGSDQAVDGADEPLEYLDVDVIDTTWMDNNVHSVRHNYFNLNPTLIEDIRQIIVHKRRARARPGVMRSSGNVYIFLVAPSHVKND